MEALRLINTVRHLKPVQFYGRLWHQLHRPRPGLDPAPPLRELAGNWKSPIGRSPRILGPTRVRFLNEEGEIAQASHWNDPVRAKLWLYNLHYFDDLAAPADPYRSDWQRGLVARWIAENPPVAGNGWEPYPLSLRIANWVKWALGGVVLEPAWRHSLAVQIRCLNSSLEWHLLGNHILANAKALALAGLYFAGAEAEHWLTRGLSIYAEQLPEQVLPDGGHFELSAMYHALVLEDLLDVLNALGAYDREESWQGPALNPLIGRMREWLAAMVHPDGGIAFFNDAAFGVAASRANLEDYATRLRLPHTREPETPIEILPQTGYVRMSTGDVVLIADVAEIGPPYLPGHAHADTLSFEISLGPERLVVNGGTSVYGTGRDRGSERATAAHSTVEIDGRNSSEVWGGFRVGRRAHAQGFRATHDGGTSRLEAEHDGYRRLGGGAVHRRLWELQPDALAITDTISGSYGKAIARFHLGEGITAESREPAREGVLRTASGRTLRWTTDAPMARVEPSAWHPEFGMTVPTLCLTVPVENGKVRTVFVWS